LEGLRERENPRFQEWLSEYSCYATYMYERNWDLATYMRHAEIRHYHDIDLIPENSNLRIRFETWTCRCSETRKNPARLFPGDRRTPGAEGE
jgi:hypothetical protein